MKGNVEMKIDEASLCDMIEHYLRENTYSALRKNNDLKVSSVYEVNSHKKKKPGQQRKFAVEFYWVIG